MPMQEEKKVLEPEAQEPKVPEEYDDEIFENGSPVNKNADGTYEWALVGFREEPISILPPPKGRRKL